MPPATSEDTVSILASNCAPNYGAKYTDIALCYNYLQSIPNQNCVFPSGNRYVKFCVHGEGTVAGRVWITGIGETITKWYVFLDFDLFVELISVLCGLDLANTS